MLTVLGAEQSKMAGTIITIIVIAGLSVNWCVIAAYRFEWNIIKRWLINIFQI